MSISYPLALPVVSVPARIRLNAHSVVALSASPFTGQQQVQQFDGQWFQADISLPAMKRETAEEWISFLLKLNGRQGTFLMGDPAADVPRGIATGTPLLNGAHSARTNSLVTDGWTPSQTGILKAGDYIQLGSGSTARLYKNLSDVNSDGSGNATLDIWPATRESYADNAVIVKSSCVGVFRLATNDMNWDIGEAQVYGIGFSAMEAL